MYKLRRYFPPDSRPGHAGGSAGAAGAPDDDVGEHVGRHPGGRRGRHPARRRAGSLGHRLRLTRQGRGRHAPQPGRPHRRAERGASTRSRRSPVSDVHLAGYSQGGMFCYQVAAYRRSKGIASIVTFGSPVDTLAALPMGLPPNLAPGVANFMADHVFNRLDIPGWLARTGFQMLDPLKTAKARVDFVRQLHDREALLPREAAAQVPGVGGLDRLVGPGDLRTAQAVHRPQPDDDRRFRHQRATGDADRHHLPGAGFRRRGRRHRPAGRRCAVSGARRPTPRSTNTSSAQAISVWSSDPKPPADLADGRRLGAVDLRRRRQARRTSSRWPISRPSTPTAASRSAPGSMHGVGEASEVAFDAGSRRRRRRRRGEQVDAHAGRRDRPHAASAGPARPDQRPHPDLAGPDHRRTGARCAATANSCCSTDACTPTRR